MSQNSDLTNYAKSKIRIPLKTDCKCSIRACNLCCDFWDQNRSSTLSSSPSHILSPSNCLFQITQPDEKQFDCDFQHLKKVIKEKETLLDEILNAKNDPNFELSREAGALYEAISKETGKDFDEKKANVLMRQEQEFQKEIESLKQGQLRLFDILSSIGSWETVKDILLLNRASNSQKTLPTKDNVSAKELYLSTQFKINSEKQELEESFQNITQQERTLMEMLALTKLLNIRIMIHYFGKDMKLATSSIILGAPDEDNQIYHLHSVEENYSKLISNPNGDYTSGDKKFDIVGEASNFFNVCFAINKKLVIEKIKACDQQYDFLTEEVDMKIAGSILRSLTQDHLKDKSNKVEIINIAKQISSTDLPSNTCIHLSPTSYVSSALKKLADINDAYKRDFMIYLTKYRKWYVDNILAQINKKYGDLLLMDLGSGSRDPASDYDIVISTKDQSVTDVLAAKDFNEFVSEHWGRPSGVVFDTNLYIKDFASLEEKLDKDIVGTPFQDRPAPTPEDYFIEADMIKQQQIALVKQRIHMSQEEWDRYVDRLIEKCKRNKDKQNIKRMYDNANKFYFKSVLELLYQINGNEMPRIKIDLEEDESCKIEVKSSCYKTYTKKELLQLEDTFKNLKEEVPVKVTEAYNQVYLERYALIRQLTNEHRNIKEHFKSRDYMPSIVKKRLDTLSVKIRVLIAESCIFGNEMYLSEGAQMHVGIEQKENKADPEIEKRRDLRLNNLANNDLLASINEQLGDFLKDISHYTHKNPQDPSEAFYRSSKYLLRLFKGVQELTSNKINRLQLNKKNQPKINGLTANLLAVEISKVLYQIRKGSEGKWAVASNHLKAQATLEEANRIFGTIDLTQFVEIIKEYVSKVNLIAYTKSNVWKMHEHLGNLSYHMKFRKERPKKFCVPTLSDKKGYQNTKQAVYKESIHIHIKRLDLGLFTDKMASSYPKNHVFIRPCNQNKYFILAILTTFMNFLMYFIPGILKNLCPPLMLLYLIIVSKMKNAKPSDRVALNFHASIRTVNNPTLNIHEESHGEIENLRVTISQIYNMESKTAHLIALLRILSLFSLLCMPWLSWLANMLNLIRYVFPLFTLIPLTVSSGFKIASFVNSTMKTIIDIFLWIRLIHRRKEVKSSAPKTNQEYQGIRREFKKYRAHTIADIVVFIFSIFVGMVMQSISSDNSALLGLVPGLSGFYVNQDLSIQNPEFTVTDHLFGWILPFIFSIVGNTIIELLATKMKGNLVMSNNTGNKNNKEVNQIIQSEQGERIVNSLLQDV